MGIFDISILALVFISGLIGFVRGFARELLGIFSWVGALVLTMFLWDLPLQIVSTYIDTEWVAKLVSGLIVFVIILIFFTAMTYSISNFVKNSAVKGIDRGFGFIYGLFRGTAILAILLYIATKTFWTERDVWLPAQESFFYKHSIVWIKRAIDATPQSSISKAKSTFESVLEKIETRAPSEEKEEKEESSDVISDTIMKEAF